MTTYSRDNSSRRHEHGFTHTPERASRRAFAWRNPDHARLVLGFTLIETLVTVAIFSAIMIVVGNVFVQLSALQRRGLGAQKVQENGLFVLESIAREIRVSTIQSGQNSDCITSFANSLIVTHPVNGAIIYFLQNGVVYRNVSGNSVPMSSSDVVFTRLYFCGMNTNIDDAQARVTIVATIQNKTQGTKDKVQFDLQTTVASRDITQEQ